ncbi:Zinc finger protein ZIC 1, partial [Podila humilis]
IEGSLTEQLSTLIKKNGFLCQKIDALQRINTDLEYKFSVTNSELERARREFSELHAKHELKNANYVDLKAVCYQLDAQLNKINGTTSDESLVSRIELGSDRKKRRLSVDIAEDEYESAYPPFEESPSAMAVPTTIRNVASNAGKRLESPPSTAICQSTWTCLWKSCNQVFGALDWLVTHVEEAHIGLGKSHYTCEWENCVVKQKPFHKHHQIIRHMRTHTGEKPFECTYGGCGKKFARSDSLLEHSRKHSGTPVDFQKMMEFSSQREQDARHLDGLMLQMDTIQENHSSTHPGFSSAPSHMMDSSNMDGQRNPAALYASPPETRDSPEKASHDIDVVDLSEEPLQRASDHAIPRHTQHLTHQQQPHQRQQHQHDHYRQSSTYSGFSQFPQGRGPSMEERSMQKARGHANTASLGLSRMDIRDDYGGYPPQRSMDHARNEPRRDYGHSHTPSLEYPPRELFARKGRGHSHTPSLEMPPIPGQMHRMDDRRNIPMPPAPVHLLSPEDRQQQQQYQQQQPHHHHSRPSYQQGAQQQEYQSYSQLQPFQGRPSGKESSPLRLTPDALGENVSQKEQTLSLKEEDHTEQTQKQDNAQEIAEVDTDPQTDVIRLQDSLDQLEAQDHPDSPVSNPTPRTPQMANKDEPMVLAATAEAVCGAPSPSLGAIKDETTTVVAVV